MSNEDRTATWEGRKMTPALKAELEKSGPLLCKVCGGDYDDHSNFVEEHIEILRSQGCIVTLGDETSVELGDELDIKVDLTSLGIHWGIIWSPDGQSLQPKEVYARCKAPADPCSVDDMLEIST